MQEIINGVLNSAGDEPIMTITKMDSLPKVAVYVG